MRERVSELSERVSGRRPEYISGGGVCGVWGTRTLGSYGGGRVDAHRNSRERFGPEGAGQVEVGGATARRRCWQRTKTASRRRGRLRRAVGGGRVAGVEMR